MARHSERKQIARGKRIAQEVTLPGETTSPLPVPGTSRTHLVPRASTSHDTTTLTAPLRNLVIENSTPENTALTPAPPVENTPKSQRINEISREKIVSDLLEKKIKPTCDNFLASLHLELCQDFGMDPVDSPFSDQLFKSCEKFSTEAAKCWRKRHGNEDRVFANNRGV